MGFYADTSLGLLCQQIVRDNPDAPPITKDNIIVLGSPTTSTANGRNTQVVLNGKAGAGFSGRKTFNYDRLNLGSLFTGITVVFNGANDSVTVGDLLPSLNAQYGLGLTVDDISNAATKLGTGYTPTALTLTVASKSLAYVGTLPVTWTRKASGLYPNSGPGNKRMLIGNLKEGYFGTVTADELFNGPTFFSKFNEGNATDIGTLVGTTVDKWLKFALDGRFLFLPYGILMNATYADLYRQGAVYEYGTVGVPPSGVAAVKQNKIITSVEGDKTWYFTPIMPLLSNTDPYAFYLNSASEQPAPESWINRLFNRVFLDTLYAQGDWDNIASGTIQNTQAFWWRDRYAQQPTQSVGSSLSFRNQGTYDRNTFVGGYRPVLELLSSTVITLPVVNLKGTRTDRRAPKLVILPTDAKTMLQSAYNVRGKSNARRAPLLSVNANLQTAVYNIRGNINPRRRPLLTTTSVADTRVNLSTQSGELDGFI